MLFALVEVDANSKVPLHTHPQEQGGIIVDGEIKLLKPGDMYIISVHGEH